MTLDELAVALRAVSPEALVQVFADFVLGWKTAPTTVEHMRRQGERYIGNVWFSTDAIHAKVYELWTAFLESEERREQGRS